MTADNRILVVGSLHLDVVVAAERLPGIDETLMGSAVRYVAGGKGGNQAVAAARHGARVSFTGRVGDDDFASALEEHLRDAGVDLGGLQRGAGVASGMSVAIVDEAGDYGAVVVSGANLDIECGSIDWPSETLWLILQNEVSPAVNLHAARLARSRGARVVLNAAPVREVAPDLAALVDVLVLNRVEASAWFATAVEDAVSAQRAAAGRANGPRDLVITLGAGGVLHHRLGETAHHWPAPRVDAFSTHGAGDVFTGVMTAELAAGHDMDIAIEAAQRQAARHVGGQPEKE